MKKTEANGVTEWYRKHRPQTLEEVVGQSKAVAELQRYLDQDEVPHALLLSGPSGCGKTTLARILARELGVGDIDLIEMNAADTRGIDTIRDLQKTMRLRPFSESGKRVLLLDEAHRLTGDAQSALLKCLEEAPEHAYYFLATTEPARLLKTIQTRCTEIKVGLLSEEELVDVVAGTVDKELDSADYPPTEILEKIAEIADGSARKAVVLAQQVAGLRTAEEQMEFLEAADVRVAAIDICRLLIKKASWDELKKVIKKVEENGFEEPEGLRYLILSYAKSVAMGKSKPGRELLILQVFRDNWWSCAKTGLVACCLEVLNND